MPFFASWRDYFHNSIWVDWALLSYYILFSAHYVSVLLNTPSEFFTQAAFDYGKTRRSNGQTAVRRIVLDFKKQVHIILSGWRVASVSSLSAMDSVQLRRSATPCFSFTLAGERWKPGCFLLVPGALSMWKLFSPASYIT